MNAHAPILARLSTDVPGWDRAAFERQIAILGELAEAGLQVALAIRDQALAPEGEDAPARADVGLAYARAAKAVRMTLALQRRYIHDLVFQDRFAEPAPQPRARPTAVDRVRHGLATGDLSEAEAVERLDLMLDAVERLEEYEDLSDRIPDRPFDDIVAQICKDLGLDPGWPEQTRERLASSPAGGGGEPPKGVEGACRRTAASPPARPAKSGRPPPSSAWWRAAPA